MKDCIIFFLCTAVLGLFSGCKSQDYQPDTYPDSQIIFGSGGGFTGMVSTYVLLEDGRIFDKAPASESFTLLKKGEKKAARACFEQLSKMKMAEMVLDYPGNLYYFIELKAPETAPYRLTWGDMNTAIPDEVSALYQALMQTTR